MKSGKTSLFLFILLGFQTFVAAQIDERSAYIGYKYNGVIPGATLSNGVKHLGGGLISDIDTEPVYGISEVVKSRTKMLWLEVSTGSDKTGITGWQVTDVLVLSNFGKTQHLFYSFDPAIYCRRNNKDVENLIAVGQIFRKQGIYKVERAWLANVRSEKFEPTSISGLKCEYSEP